MKPKSNAELSFKIEYMRLVSIKFLYKRRAELEVHIYIMRQALIYFMLQVALRLLASQLRLLWQVKAQRNRKSQHPEFD